MVYLLKNFEVSKVEINRFVYEFENIIEHFRKQVPINIFNMIIHTNTRGKIVSIKNYIKS